jgi:hypothetical protein
MAIAPDKEKFIESCVCEYLIFLPMYYCHTFAVSPSLLFFFSKSVSNPNEIVFSVLGKLSLCHSPSKDMEYNIYHMRTTGHIYINMMMQNITNNCNNTKTHQTLTKTQ